MSLLFDMLSWRRKWQPTPVFLPGKSQGLQPTRLPHPWDFPGESTGVGCHCLLRYAIQVVITFLPRSKRLLISWLQSRFAVILDPQKIKSDTVSPSISHEVMGPDAMLVLSMCLIGLVVFCEVGIQLTFPYGYQIVPKGRFLCPFSWKCPFWVYILRSFF